MDDPAGIIASQTNRGFTGHEELDPVALVHMNSRVYDPLLARFGTPDPTTESPFSTQGWNRYSYVGNSPLNFTDPSGYCFLGCFWQSIFHAVQNLFRSVPILGSVLQIAAAAICGAPCAILASAFVTGITSGNLGLALRAGFIAAVTAGVIQLGSEVLGNFGGAFASGGESSVSAGGSSGWSYGPPMHLELSDAVDGASYRQITLEAITVTTPSAFQYVSQAAHWGLMGASFWPSIFGSAASALDAGLYAFEGSWASAGISLAAAGSGSSTECGSVVGMWRRILRQQTG